MNQLKVALLACTVAGLAAIWTGNEVQAASIRMQPALVKGVVAEREKQKGYVDVINPTSSQITVTFSVQGFRQINNDGSLEFYTDAAISQGVLLDYNQVELKGHEAMRLYYQVDGAKLPSGDVLAAIFASLAPATNAPAAQAVRVGTLLVLQHGAAPPRTVRVEALKAPFFQTGQQLVADFALKNTAAPSNAYFPLVTVATWPYGTKQIDGPLIAAGNSRAVRFVKPGNYIGPILMTVNAEGHEQRVLLFAATGFWQWLAPLLCALVVGVIAALFKKRHHRAKH